MLIAFYFISGLEFKVCFEFRSNQCKAGRNLHLHWFVIYLREEYTAIDVDIGTSNIIGIIGS